MPRRLIRFASEDVGLADPRALEMAVAAYQACHYIGMPECNLNLTQAVVYLSLAPKSNALDVAYQSAKQDALTQLAEPGASGDPATPHPADETASLREGYQYAHHTQDKLTTMQCLPDSLAGREYYRPTRQGVEGKFKDRLEQIKEWKRRHREEK